MQWRNQSPQCDNLAFKQPSLYSAWYLNIILSPRLFFHENKHSHGNIYYYYNDVLKDSLKLWQTRVLKSLLHAMIQWQCWRCKYSQSDSMRVVRFRVLLNGHFNFLHSPPPSMCYQHRWWTQLLNHHLHHKSGGGGEGLSDFLDMVCIIWSTRLRPQPVLPKKGAKLQVLNSHSNSMYLESCCMLAHHTIHVQCHVFYRPYHVH